MPNEYPLQIGLLVFPGLTQLDLTGPYEVLSRLSNSRVHLSWKTVEPILSDRGLTLLPTGTFAQATQMDLLMVPGGPGVAALMEDLEVLAFLRRQAQGARFVASVCTGALVLGAAGLLRGYRATTHWASLEFLPALGAIACADRIVVDRNRITGGGVTAGIDFALQLAAELRGEAEARLIQLQMEYNPSPPFLSGHPDVAQVQTLQAALEANATVRATRRALVERVRGRLGVPLDGHVAR
ncbi:MAG: DJ-1/PfpI family protein [Bryobacteraceae bacterium]|nr:DJ-1/PfpI family protein [Bryobacteraceae bacterium]